MMCTVVLHLVIFDKEGSLSGNLHYQWRSSPATSSLSGQMFALESLFIEIDLFFL